MQLSLNKYVDIDIHILVFRWNHLKHRSPYRMWRRRCSTCFSTSGRERKSCFSNQLCLVNSLIKISAVYVRAIRVVFVYGALLTGRRWTWVSIWTVNLFSALKLLKIAVHMFCVHNIEQTTTTLLFIIILKHIFINTFHRHEC